jgi:lysozyme family protein
VGFVVGATGDRIVLLGGNAGNDQIPGPATVPAADDDEAIFGPALAHVLTMEGGYSDDPYDPGGPTNFGITLKVYAAYTGRTLEATSRARLKDELRAIRPETVRAIYRARYWGPAECASLAPGLALFHFDAAVNHGVGTAIRSLQEAVHVEADGEIGPITRSALRASDPRDVIARYAAIRKRRYRALPHFWRFGRGWLNRVAATRTAALARAAHSVPASANPQPPTQGDRPMTTATEAPATAKWWGHSLTVWGAVVTAAAAILPALGPIIGLEITSDVVRQVGADVGAIVQAITGVIGTFMTLYGRARATTHLVRRDLSLRV